MNQLTTSERAELEACEVIIERGLKTFVEVGQALMKINNQRLYRATHKTFEVYCKARWDMRRNNAYYLIRAAKMDDVLHNASCKLPSIRAANELAPLLENPDRLRDTWDEIVEEHGPNPTSAQVREKVRGGFAAPSLSTIGFVMTLEDLVQDINEARLDWSTLPDEYRDKLNCYIEFLQTL